MKLVCRKETDAKQMLELIRRFLETESLDYPILKENLILELALRDQAGQDCPKNQDTIYFEEQDLETLETSASPLEAYYNNDTLTKLYNRGKYERDIVKLQTNNTEAITCIYIDAIGLHEINNHLGHAAGDQMLCTIAEGIRQNFTHSLAYRIGGDEFVILCFHQKKSDLREMISRLRQFLNQADYKISIGMEITQENLTLTKAIEQAEAAMRQDKEQFYQQGGAQRQLRSLNDKLEKLLLEKQDASQFLNVIAPEYKGVYMVNPAQDTCRYIYIPEYFKQILETTQGSFSQGIRIYCSTLVCEPDQKLFYDIFEYDTVLNQLRQGKQIDFSYRKKDGSRIRLQITIYDPNALDNNEMLWIFMDGDRM